MCKSAIGRMWVMVVMVVGMLALAAPAAWATDFTVTNTNDSGAGSLRQAILNANNNQGADTINFNIPGWRVHKIAPSSQLPDINDSVVIDGYTQPGASPNTEAVGNDAVLKIELDGTDAEPMSVSGLQIGGSNVVVRGLVINHFSTGINIFASDYRTSCSLSCVPTDNTRIEGNFIGTDPSGIIAEGNRNDGVVIASGATNSTVGGTSPGARNVISGNSWYGVFIGGNGARGNKVEGNYIGTDPTGTKDLGNTFVGVVVHNGASENSIGSTASGARNIIAFNDGAGIFVDSYTDGPQNINFPGTGNAILSNSIFSNLHLGIDLGGGGVIANDSGDGDTGPNDLQNFPTLTKANEAPNGFTKIEGTLNSTPTSNFNVQFFSSPQKDP